MLAISLLDSPWVVLVFLVGSALINWLTRRREQKAHERETGTHPQSMPEPERVDPGPIDPDIERALRRLLGQEEPPPEHRQTAQPPMAVPPPIPSSLPPPPVMPQNVPSWSRIKAVMGGEDAEEGDLADTRTLAATIARRSEMAHVEQAHVRPISALARQLRNPRAAREAWKMSVIMGPPRALES